VKKCRGACIGEESPAQHQLRLMLALSPQRVADWPWPGRIVVRERDAQARFEEAHVFDRWCHIGTARSEDDLSELLEARFEIEFDPDVYQIVRAFTAKHRSQVTVVRPARFMQDAAEALFST
jgi:DNA polymerase III subunit epsilon